MLLEKVIDNKIFYLINNEYDFQNALLDEHHELYDVTKNYLITDNIDLINISQNFKIPIKNFSGILDGNNKAIFNFDIITVDANASCVGIFSYVRKATIKNITITTDLKLIGKSNIGCLIGYATNCKIENCNLVGDFDITTVDGYNIGLLVGKIKSSIISNVNIATKNSVIRGHHNIGGFIGMIYDSEIKDSFVCGKLILFGHNKVDLNNELSFTEDLYMKIDHINSTCPAKQLGGFIGKSKYSFITNCNTNISGVILGYTYIGGFVGLDESSKFTDCCMEVNGSIMKTYIDSCKIDNIDEQISGIFCGYNIDSNNKYSIFCDCKINITTKLDNELVNIINISKFEKIANTFYKVTFKNCIYPDTYYSLLKLKNELISNDTIIYDIFSYILTYKQLASLQINDILINTENEILLEIYKDFKNKWINLNIQDQLLYCHLGFNEETFNCCEFPNVKWVDFTDIQKYSALKLGFNINIWDNQFIQKVRELKSTFDFTSIYGINNQIRQILRFSLNIDKLIINIPYFIKKIILIEIKDYIIKNLKYEINLNEQNIKIYFTDKYLLDIMIIFTHEPIDCEKDDLSEEIIEFKKCVEKLESNKLCILEPVYIYMTICLNYNNVTEVNNFFKNNNSIYKEFISSLINKLFDDDINVDVDVLFFDIDYQIISVKISLLDSNLEHFNTISYELFISLLNKVIPNNFIKLPTEFLIKTNILNNLLELKEEFCYKTQKLDYAINVQNTFGEPSQTLDVYDNIIGQVRINNKNANLGDIVLVYVDNQLRGIDCVKIINDKPIVNIKISTNHASENYIEVATFKVYQKNTSLLFEVPNNLYHIKNIHTSIKNNDCYNLLDIHALGKIRPSIIQQNDITSLCPVIYYNQSYKLYSNIMINYTNADICDILLVYSENELRGKININVKYNKSYAIGLIQSSGHKELLTFKVYSKTYNAIFSVPNIELVVEGCNEIGTCESPIQITAIGNVCINYWKYLNLYNLCDYKEIKNTCIDTCTDTCIDTCIDIPKCPPIDDTKCDFRKTAFLNYYQSLKLNSRGIKYKI